MNEIIIFGAKYIIYILIALAVYCFFAIEENKRREFLIFATITLVLSYVLAKISSLLYYDPRPFVIGPPAGGFAPLVPHVADNGFPSDHTLLASAIAFVILNFKRNWGTFLIILAFLVGISRVLAGVHHASDIIGSFVISGLVCYVTYHWIMPMFLKKK